MAARNHVGEQRGSRRFFSVLSSAVLEWFLILLLFVDAFFSYFGTKFARYCKLKTPCLFCSRLDHILGRAEPGFYKHLLCDNHKLEISSWVYCQVHKRLADAHEMCERCVVSFAKGMKSNPKFESGVKVPLPDDNLFPGSSRTRHCSCCFELFEDKQPAIRLLEDESIGHEGGDISLSSSSGWTQVHHEADLMSSREKSLGTGKDHYFEKGDCLSHVGYTELKIASDMEAEVPISHDDRNAPVHVNNDIKEDVTRSLQPEPATYIPTSITSTPGVVIREQLTQPATVVSESLTSVPEKSHDLIDDRDISSVPGAIGHGLEELNWTQVEVAKNPSAPSQSISQVLPEDANAKLNAFEVGKSTIISASSCGEITKALPSIEVNSRTSQNSNFPVSAMHVTPMDLNDAYKLAVGTRGCLPSPTFAELVSGRESSRIHEDLKLLLSQISASRGLEFPWNDVTPSPRLHAHNDESKSSDASSSVLLHNISKRLSIDRNESGIESLDGSIISEIEGESPLDRLKRQIELDRKSMSILYKELEEERNASAIAANQAMAMITRLQEEKAAMQMEALQYQRMMEEQAEYDQEALQEANELLNQREKEMQDLEAELECFKQQFTDEPLSDKFIEPNGDLEATEKNIMDTPFDKEALCQGSSFHDGVVGLDQGLSSSAPYKEPLLDFEDDKNHISECLRKLEKKLLLFSNNGVQIGDSRSSTRAEGFPDGTTENINGENYEQQHALVKGALTSNGHCSDEEAVSSDLDYPHLRASMQDSQIPNKENQKETMLCPCPDDDIQYSMTDKESNSLALKIEISRLHDRMMALEADRDFLEHAINTLRSGNEGVQFIREIACNLRELRKLGITRGEHTVP